MIFRYLTRKYADLMSYSDPRTENLFLMSSPLPTITICLSYVYFVKVLGPRLMMDRKPLELRIPMIIYNILMVIISSIITYNGFGYYINYASLSCQPVELTWEGYSGFAFYNSYIYFLSKFIEMSDTLFFVARKKFSHISTLHVIHHGIMPFSVWWGMKFVPGGNGIFFGFANSIVHVIMYTYYALAALGPHMNKYLWWKKYLTMIQLIQFCAIGIHSAQIFFYPCNFPKLFSVWIGAHGILFLFLFTDFYKKAYTKASNKQTSKIVEINNNTNKSINKASFLACSPMEQMINSKLD